jgi:AMP nucleosidase
VDGGPRRPHMVAPCRHNRRLRQKTTKARMTVLPLYIAPTRFDDADAALAQVRRIYDGSIAHLRGTLQRFVAGEDVGEHVRACYPFVRVHTDTVARADSRLAYGFVAGPGTYETTLTRPDLLRRLLPRAVRLLLKNHGVALEVGTSTQPIPVHFSSPSTTTSKAA